MGCLPNRPLGCCLPWGGRRRGGRRQGQSRASPGQSPTHCGRALPNSPGDSRLRGDRPSGSSCQLLSRSVTELCGCPINADNSIWHRVPVQTTAHQEAFMVVKTNKSPSTQRPPVPPPLPLLGVLHLTLEQLRPTNPGLLTPVRSNLCPSRAGSSRGQEPGSGVQIPAPRNPPERGLPVLRRCTFINQVSATRCPGLNSEPPPSCPPVTSECDLMWLLHVESG